MPSGEGGSVPLRAPLALRCMPQSWPSGKANPNLSVSQAWYKHRTMQKTTTTKPYNAAPKADGLGDQLLCVGLLALRRLHPESVMVGGGPIPSLPWGMRQPEEVGVGGEMQLQTRPWFICSYFCPRAFQGRGGWIQSDQPRGKQTTEKRQADS